MIFLRKSFSILLASALALPSLCWTQTAADTSKKLKGLDSSLLDTSVDPCVNFYQYACGKWLKQNSIPADESSYSRSTELEDENELVLKSILERAAAGGSERTPSEQKIGDYYATCIDSAAINQTGLKPLERVLEPIRALQSKNSLSQLVGKLQVQGINTFFDFTAAQDFKDATQQIATFDQPTLGLPEKGYYARTDAESARLREQYKTHITRTFELIGESSPQAAKDAGAVLKLETELAKISRTNVERRDPLSMYHLLPMAKLQGMTQSFDYPAFLRAVDSPAAPSVNVVEPGFFAGLNQVLAGSNLDDLKAFLTWSVMHHAHSTALPQALDEEAFSFYAKILHGQLEQQPRWKRCVRAVDTDLGEALGQVYVAQRFTPGDKQRTQELTRDVEAAMNRNIDHLDWMSDATKVRAKEKLHSVANKIGYPDKWRDYSSLTIVRGDALGNALRSTTFEERRVIAKIGQPVDRGEWDMTPPTVNAYYNPQMNDINFPAGILQPPFFDPSQDDAVNYGDAGGTIGHELTHGFDDEGRQFDGQGNLQDWWTPSDEKKFSERSDCLVNEYNSFVAVDALHVDGKLTLGENIADLGGLKLAFLAYLDRAQKSGIDVTKKGSPEYDELTPEQQFFVSYGQGWCQNSRPENLRLRVQSDPHSPEEFRVNGILPNLPEFQKAFGCKTGTPMAPAKRCSIW